MEFRGAESRGCTKTTIAITVILFKVVNYARFFTTQRPEEHRVSRKYQLVMISRHVNTPSPYQESPLT